MPTAVAPAAGNTTPARPRPHAAVLRPGFDSSPVPAPRPVSGCEFVSEVVRVNHVTIAAIPEAFEDVLVNIVADRVYGPVGEDGVEPAGVRRAEPLVPVSRRRHIVRLWGPVGE